MRRAYKALGLIPHPLFSKEPVYGNQSANIVDPELGEPLGRPPYEKGDSEDEEEPKKEEKVEEDQEGEEGEN